MSAIRSPKNPQTHSITVSPGSSRLLMPASIPAEPVPDSAIVRLSSVWKTTFRSSDTSSSTSMKAGSRYPITGDIIARSTLGSALLGPGPSRVRGGSSGIFDSGSGILRHTQSSSIRLG